MNKLDHLKAILHSKRANIFYLEHCKILQKDGRVVYCKEDGFGSIFMNIPIANTMVILLGSGTSITQSAFKMLADASVLVGFCGGGGTPLIAGMPNSDIVFCEPQSEYRPTEFLQKWVLDWFDNDLRLKKAKRFSQARVDFVEAVWSKKDFDNLLDDSFHQVKNIFLTRVDGSKNENEIMLAEAEYIKSLYRHLSFKTNLDDFRRDKEIRTGVNGKLTHGNYLAYGIASTCLWVLGIPSGFAVLHGKTRRGGLVFDLADTIKDGIVLPYAFFAERDGLTDSEYKKMIVEKFLETEAMNFIFNLMQE